MLKIFKILKQNLQILGILHSQSNETKFLNANRINLLRHFLIFSTQIFYFLSTLWFLLSGAETFDEYIDGFLFVSSATLHLTLYSVLTWQKPEIAKLIADLEILVQRSKFI